MNVLIDLLGALMIASMLLLMMITFQFQLRDTADRTIFAAQMMTHEQKACTELNHLIALAGINLPADSAMVQADSTVMTFRTFWDFKHDQMTSTANSIQLSLESNKTDIGRQLHIIQSASPVYDLGYIFWLEELRFVYYDKAGAQIFAPIAANDRKRIRSVEVNMTFRRDPPSVNTSPLRTRVQLRCYLMNCYLRDGMGNNPI